ncbi:MULTISPECIES: D-2-hydroxyacid dehydrogenase family protein [Streptomyces]|uniref:D-2-hydroxyacid dehydrogenase family protein n=1 Tax=Streptomyces tsukubensis (strain DSM 42081 / NBRC 108919 / NRRL 18488 / 9993) TaxID=1114943 RepID=I2MV47_STRT9|nr:MULTISPECIES: D-2-hydroxyacid dehydrogenase family protein [Streptomyces]AZK93130.1 hydroxyacid dehydrogenase [Streptomyces tsukubensis]EIF88644.1 NAD-binding D-isomer specific 2-hydroxyacid dehydrogenase [Streptomyces tsukubensis NRRL18488]MYS64000.1 D-2-hydroxyacid dehydrogenase family protein [Streptomyces sp. SID5473]QKM70704.1 D-2-hydroxyacid dehydrogenase family protein [Streptomyces tsukubensis NRRL18488]TAI41199.1 D-2-hydroxyacid dehydrogenase family protein [Streptomyces tsukubensi
MTETTGTAAGARNGRQDGGRVGGQGDGRGGRLRCAVLDDYQDIARTLADWDRIGDRVDTRFLHEPLSTHDEVVAAVGDCEILVVMRERTPFPAALLDRLPRLRLLITSGMRNAALDLAAAARNGVTVCGTASNSEPPAELTWALILGLARGVTTENAALRAGGPWQQTLGADLYGRRLGLLGLGKIGTKVARVGAAFGMDVAAWSPNLDHRRAAEEGVTPCASREELLETSDVVSVHLVLGDRSRGLIGEAELRRMRRTAFLVNTSRAGIVDQTALLRALREGWIAGAGADVFATEPLPADDPLRTAPNFLGLPHLGYVTRRNYEGYFGQAVEDVEAYLAGRPVRTLG